MWTVSADLLTVSADLLTLPLVQLLSQPVDKSADLVLVNQNTAVSLLSRIQEGALSVVDEDTFSATHSLANLYLFLAHQPTVAMTVLQDEHCLKDMVSGYDQLCIVLCALAVRRVRSVDCIRSILSTLTSIARYHPTVVSQHLMNCVSMHYSLNQGPSLLPLFIHLLSLSSCPHTKLAVLHSVPNLATHKLTTSSVLNTVRVLGENPSLVSMATRLFGWTWEKQDHIFPSLLEYITRRLPSDSMVIQSEIRVSRAAVLRAVCRERGEVHGETVLSLINTYIESGDTLVVAMAIQALTELCRRDIVGVATVWSVVGGRLSEDSRYTNVMMSSDVCTMQV